MSVAVAATFGLVPTVMVGSPAFAASTLSIADATVTEGGDLTFTLNNTGGAATYAIVITPGSTNPAAASADYNATSVPASVVFSGATGSATVVVHTVDDQLYEPNETITLTATNAVPTSFTATGTIIDNDPIPSYALTASPTTIPEPLTGTTPTTITATLSAISGVDTVVTVNTANGTAVAGTDYTAISAGSISIPAGTLAGTTTTTILSDGVKDEHDTETFAVGGVATNVSPASASTTVSIADAQSTPTLTLTGGGAGSEGTSLTFGIAVGPTASDLPITVHWDAVAAPVVTGHEAATPSTDFTYPASRTVTIAAGVTTASIVIPLTADAIDELPEDFAVELSSPTNATLGTTSKVVGQINDINTPPTVTITPTAVTEGDSGKVSRTFTATLSGVSGRPVNVTWATAIDGSGLTFAAPVKDYIDKTGTLTFPIGTTTQTFSVEIVGDKIDEGTGETFRVNLTNVDSSASLGAGFTALTITDDDAAPTFSFDDLSMNEGNTTSAVLLPLRLTGSSDHVLAFDLTDLGTGTATLADGAGPNDYDSLSGSIVLPPETTTAYAVVVVTGDLVHEADETVKFSAVPDGSSLAFVTNPAPDAATLTLVNDDAAPNLEINSVTGNEGDTVAVTGTVTGISDSTTALNIVFAGGSSHGSTAAEANDFTNPGAQIKTITAGTQPGTIIPVGNLVLTNDTVGESAETIIGTGFGIGNVGTVTEGIITIAESDGGNIPDLPAPTMWVPASVTGPSDVPITGSATTSGSIVDLWGAPFGSPLAKIDSTHSRSAGAYSFSTHIDSGYRFKVTANGKSSSVKQVWVIVVLSLSTSAGKGTIGMSATGNPPTEDTMVSFQIQNSRGTWVTLGSDKTGPTGNARATLKNLKSGAKFNCRAYIGGTPDMGITGGPSVTKWVTVR